MVRQDGDKSNSTCVPCPQSGCLLECPGGKIDSVASAEYYRGCTHVKGTLEITLRAGGGKPRPSLDPFYCKYTYDKKYLRKLITK